MLGKYQMVVLSCSVHLSKPRARRKTSRAVFGSSTLRLLDLILRGTTIWHLRELFSEVESLGEVEIQQKNRQPYNGYTQYYRSQDPMRRSMSCSKMDKSSAG
ncbi:hypothetical protein RvY_12823-2 [Ramazzottius varieornatus]|uniref:Uncharacterized protein n=1 Tax=Ramazzottius varieornatus TaxID=947166 RepID=A0A1D1VKU3_RAMVA|nr:hypothetical protein RvY_12823-2 [Ramazzottius varieornatus]